MLVFSAICLQFLLMLGLLCEVHTLCTLTYNLPCNVMPVAVSEHINNKFVDRCVYWLCASYRFIMKKRTLYSIIMWKMKSLASLVSLLVGYMHIKQHGHW
jgi:hypothetical protein